MIVFCKENIGFHHNHRLNLRLNSKFKKDKYSFFRKNYNFGSAFLSNKVKTAVHNKGFHLDKNIITLFDFNSIFS